MTVLELLAALNDVSLEAEVVVSYGSFEDYHVNTTHTGRTRRSTGHDDYTYNIEKYDCDVAHRDFHGTVDVPVFRFVTK